METENHLLTIRKEGHSNVLSVTKILPLNWRYIRSTKINAGKSFVIIRFERVDIVR